MEKDIKLGRKALHTKKAVRKAGKAIKDLLTNVKDVSVKLDLESKTCSIEIKGR